MRRISHARLAAILLIALVAALGATNASPGFAAGKAPPPPSRIRDVHFTYHAEIRSINPRAKRIDVWIPLPRRDANQSVSHFSIRSNLKHRIVDLPRFGNQAVYFHAASPLPRSVSMTIKFDAVRREATVDLARAGRPLPEPVGGSFTPFLSPDRMIPIGGEIARVAARLDHRDAGALQQAHAIYQYVTRTMTYVHTGKGVGHGDALFACDRHHGNCTDFHSLFIALARSRGIPARFVIGLPFGKPWSGTIPGYHCWAEFYAGGVWVPIDAAKAWQMPARHNYYFGHLDAGRIAFSMGRDLELVPRQHGAPLNYFIYPYAEIDGKPLPEREIEKTFSYRDLPGEQG